LYYKEFVLSIETYSRPYSTANDHRMDWLCGGYLRTLGVDPLAPQDRLLRRPGRPLDEYRRPSIDVVMADSADSASEILLIRSTDNGNRALPGSAIDLGLELLQAWRVKRLLHGHAAAGRATMAVPADDGASHGTCRFTSTLPSGQAARLECLQPERVELLNGALLPPRAHLSSAVFPATWYARASIFR